MESLALVLTAYISDVTPGKLRLMKSITSVISAGLSSPKATSTITCPVEAILIIMVRSRPT